MSSSKQSLLLSFILFSCCLTALNCGDILAKREQIVKDYYVVQGDIGDDISVCYKVDQNSYVGRVPPKAVEYAILGDSLLLVKSHQKADTIFYVLNMKLDNPFADEKTYLIGSFNKNEFKDWREKLGVTFDFENIR